jgi:GTP:adenosylcobinamide-phosphate guanylyltransferase
MTRWTAVVLAGSRPGRDEFAAQFGTDIKALIPVGGEPMVRRPVRALLEAEDVGDVIVLSQAPDRIAHALPTDPRIKLRKSEATIAATMLELCLDKATSWPLLVTTADHALLDVETIDEFCAYAEGDISIGVVERELLQDRFPVAQRTWLKFRGGAYTGANLFALSSPKAAAAVELWRSVEQDRKKGWRIIALLGPFVLIGSLLRLLTIDQALRHIGRKLGLDVTVVQLSNPIAGVDVDKRADHMLAESILAGKA